MFERHEANNAIKELSLGYNKIGDEGAIALADGLEDGYIICFLEARTVVFFWP